MTPTRRQRAILERLAAGATLCYLEGETSLCVVSPDGDVHGRVFGGMRWRLTRDGWLSRNRITDAGRAVIQGQQP